MDTLAAATRREDDPGQVLADNRLAELFIHIHLAGQAPPQPDPRLLRFVSESYLILLMTGRSMN